MAEIRTFDPSEGNPIAKALREAMGEPVRPVTPGQPAPRAARPDQPAAANQWVSLGLGQPQPTPGDEQE